MAKEKSSPVVDENVDKQVRLDEIKVRVAEIEKESVLEGADVAALMAEFKELLNEAAQLSKTTKTKKAGTGAPRSSKLGVLKGLRVTFNPRSTLIDLEGTLIGLAVDGRNGLHILSIQHETGMKFNKKIDGVTLIDPTDEQVAYHEKLISEQEALVEEIKATKEAEKEAEAAEAAEAETNDPDQA